MIPYHPHKPGGPTAEELAAYVDGELDLQASRDVAAWLDKHPEAARDVQALEQLAHLWQVGSPPEPTPQQWAEVFAGVTRALPAGKEVRPAGSRRLYWLGPTAAVAAAVLAVVLLNRPHEPRVILPPRLEQPFPVATDDEIRIISMDDADRAALVVGLPPLREPLALLEPDEVTVDAIEPDAGGMQPRFVGDSTPMIITPSREEAPKGR
jgi:hypothetical protein